MRHIIKFFIDHHKLATLFTIMVILLGLKSVLTMNRALFPKIELSQVSITTMYPGASPEDVELNVTNRIERELKGIPGIKKITSVSLENISSIDIRLKSDYSDQDAIKRDIRDAVGRITDFPDKVREVPLITEVKTSSFPVVEVGITGDIPYRELRKKANQFEKQLRNINGVASVSKYGYRAREVKINFSPEKMQQYQIPLNNIISAIRSRNVRATGGTLESYTSAKNVVTLAQFKHPMEVEDVIIHSTPDGTQIKVKDIAIVSDDFEEEKMFARVNNKSNKAISFLVTKSESSDIVKTVDKIKLLAKQYRDESNGILEFLFVNDQSMPVKEKFEILKWNSIIGLSFIIIILAVFLNIRTAIWVAFGIPITICGVVFLLPYFNVDLDTITIAAMLLVVGIIVDDGIIISENIFKRRELGDSPTDAAINGLSEVFYPVLTTVLTTFLVFAPLLFFPGEMGKFIFVIPLVVSLSLFVSLAESVIALPVHLIAGLKKIGTGKQNASRDWFNSFKNLFEKTSKKLLRFRYIWLISAILLFFLSIFLASTTMKKIIFPTKIAELFYISIELPLGTPLYKTSEKVKEIEDIVALLPKHELRTSFVRIGASGDAAVPMENNAIFAVNLTGYNDRDRTINEIVDELKVKTSKLEGFKNITYIIVAGGPGESDDIKIDITGSHDLERKQCTDAVVTYLSKIEGIENVDRSDKGGKGQIEIKLKYDWLARYGLSVQDIAQTVRVAFEGEIVTNVRYGNEDVDFRVVVEKKYRKNPAYLPELLISNNRGELIPLKKVAYFVSGPGTTSFRHFNGERTITITAGINQDKIKSMEKIQATFQEKFSDNNDFPNTKVNMGGSVGEMDKTMINVISTFIISIIGIYFLLVLLFNSFTQPFLVMVSIPFGIIGVVFTLLIHNEPISLMASIGIIGLVGIVVNDALVLVDYINKLRKIDPNSSMINLVSKAAAERLRPIILTTLSTVVGLIPLAYGIGGIDGYMSPMALTLGYGLLFSTPLTLLLIPALYLINEDIIKIVKKNKQEISQ